MEQIKIQVFKVLKDQSKEIYRNIVHVDSLDSFPYVDFLKTFRILYPECVIQFSIL